MTAQRPTPQDAKDQAKRLRADMAERGQQIGHAQSLELIAHQYGFHDWNAMAAAIRNDPVSHWEIGDRVRGTYISQPFTATVIDVSKLRPGWFRLGLDLDEAVDVVTFDSFSNIRKRLRGSIGPKGHSLERTSDGVPQLIVEKLI